MTNTLKTLSFVAASTAFALGAVAITFVMWALSMAGYQLVPGQLAQDWLTQGVSTVAYAWLAGLLVDAARLLSTLMVVAWRSMHGRADRTWRDQYDGGARRMTPAIVFLIEAD